MIVKAQNNCVCVMNLPIKSDKRATSDGIVPDTLLSCNLSVLSETSFPSSVGIVPSSTLPSRKAK